jgi:hypothetical protein
MRAEDLPLTGDWDGDGRDTPGYFRPSTARWTVTNGLGDNQAATEFAYGVPGDLPLTGDWDGDGQDTVAIYRPATGEFHFQNSLTPGKILGLLLGPNATPVVADWAGHGVDTPAVVTGSRLRIQAANCNCSLVNQPDDLPIDPAGTIIAGRWALPSRK